MKLKELEEKKAETLKQIEAENNSETRSIEKIDTLLKELDQLNASIDKEKEIEERILKLNQGKGDKKEMTKEKEVRNYNAEIRQAIIDEKELDITNFEIEERTIGVGDKNPTNAQVTLTTKDIAKKTFSNQILKKVSETSDLYRYVRKENFGSATHVIPVQATKVGRFVNVKELHDYTEKNIDFTPINMMAHKYGNISVVSEECLADTGYNIMGELIEQYGEGVSETIDYLLVKGDDQVQGLEKFISAVGVADAGVQKTELASAVQGDQEQVIAHLVKVYNSLPKKYAKNGTWVISTDLANFLNATVDANGRPLLDQDYSRVPFGGQPTPMLLGRPVVISDHVDKLDSAQHKCVAFFGDLSKALICGIRQNFTIKTSTEYKFANDGVAIKGQIRLDIKKALGEALAVMVKGA